MLGHVAQSIGGALPGVAAAVTLLGQFFGDDADVTSTSAPAGTQFIFAEAIGAGGMGYAESGIFGLSGGAAGSDAIVPYTQGQSLTFSIARTSTSTTVATPPTTISVGGTVVVSAASSEYVNKNPNGSAAAGKYVGSAQANTANGWGAKGGGRLAGSFKRGPLSNAGLGCGSASTANGQNDSGGGGAVCLTFFSSYDAALAFARSVYGGVWNP